MRKTTEQFIKDAILVHGDKYTYEHVMYTTNRAKVTITCPKHGTFDQSPVVHISNKTGCPACAILVRQQTNMERYGARGKPPAPESSAKRRETNLERYGQAEVFQTDYCKAKKKQSMLDRYGVPHAMMSADIKQKRSSTCFDKWGVSTHKQKHMIECLHLLDSADWLTEQYVTQSKNAYQIADSLGVERTTVLNRLKKHNIDIRPSSPFSQKCTAWLNMIMKDEDISIIHAANGGEYKLPGTQLRVDGYCASNNTVYEFYGDYWHGNPRVFDGALFNSQKKQTMKELYDKTMCREHTITKLGYNLITMWEHDFDG